MCRRLVSGEILHQGNGQIHNFHARFTFSVFADICKFDLSSEVLAGLVFVFLRVRLRNPYEQIHSYPFY